MLPLFGGFSGQNRDSEAKIRGNGQAPQPTTGDFSSPAAARAVSERAGCCFIFLLFLLRDRPPILGSVAAQRPSVTANSLRLETNRRRLEANRRQL